MPEFLRPQRNQPAQKAEAASEQQQFIETPEYQERRERSYTEARAFIERVRTFDSKELAESMPAARFEHTDDAETKKVSEELTAFFGQQIPAGQNMDPMQHQINISKGLGDTYARRDADGRITSALQSFTREFPGKPGEPNGIGLGIWYLANDKEYSGKPLSPALVCLAVERALAQAEQQGKVFKSIFAEADPEIEVPMNRFGLNALHYEKPDGTIVEFQYEAPPEDESEEGTPERFVVRFFDGTERPSAHDMVNMSRGIHAEYSREEYFTPEYLRFAQEHYNARLPEDEQDDTRITSRVARAYHRDYIRKVGVIDAKLESGMSGVSELFPLSAREREALKAQGRMVIEWAEKEE